MRSNSLTRVPPRHPNRLRRSGPGMSRHCLRPATSDGACGVRDRGLVVCETHHHAQQAHERDIAGRTAPTDLEHAGAREHGEPRRPRLQSALETIVRDTHARMHTQKHTGMRLGLARASTAQPHAHPDVGGGVVSHHEDAVRAMAAVVLRMDVRVRVWVAAAGHP